jgi:hypothetical protein
VLILFKRNNTVLMLEHHVQSDDHQLLEVRVRDFWVEEVLGNEFTKSLLVSCVLEAADIQLLLLLLGILIEVSVSSFEDAEDFKGNFGEYVGEEVDETLLASADSVGWVVKVVDDSH